MPFVKTAHDMVCGGLACFIVILLYVFLGLVMGKVKSRFYYHRFCSAFQNLSSVVESIIVFKERVLGLRINTIGMRGYMFRKKYRTRPAQV